MVLMFEGLQMYPLNWTKFKGKSWKLDYSMRVNPTNCTYPKNHVKFIIVAILFSLWSYCSKGCLFKW